MTKQEYLIKLLESLESVRRPASGFLVVLRAGGFDENITDTLIGVIERAMKDTTSAIEKEKLSVSLGVLEKIKDLEADSLVQDEQDCEELLGMLEMI